MKFLFLNKMLIAILLLCVAGLAACDPKAPVESPKKIPAGWSGGFTMPTLLDSSNVAINSIGDLSKLIKAPWYAQINVANTKVGETVFSSCADYFDKVEPATRTSRDNEMSAYLEFKIMCEATQLLINAGDSKESFIPDNALSDDAPQMWPKEMALQISTEESKRSAQNPNLKTWADVTPVIKHESQTEFSSIYFHKGGRQAIEILGHGDINNDGIEDILLVSRDSVEGGNYFNMRLFVLSVDSRGKWTLIKEI